VPVDIGQSVVPALKFVGELLMIDSKQMHDGGIQIMDVDGILGNVVTVVIRGPQ